MTKALQRYEEETAAELLRGLPPAPAAWVQAARELPAARREIDGIVERARADSAYRRELLADLEGALLRAGHGSDAAHLAVLRARLAAVESDLCN